MSDYFSLEQFIKNIPQILPCLTVTFKIVFFAMLFGTILAIFVAIARINKIKILDQFLTVYISFMRGTPLLVQIMICYYGLPVLVQALFGININRWDTLIFVILGFVLNEGAFLGEVFRAGIESIPKVQKEAALSIGMTSFQMYTRIILPQVIRIVIPSYGTDLVGVFHNTSLVYMLGVIDIMGRALAIGAATYHSLEAYLFVAILYIVISLILNTLFSKLDKKLTY